jgi:hypothetical protein
MLSNVSEGSRKLFASYLRWPGVLAQKCIWSGTLVAADRGRRFSSAAPQIGRPLRLERHAWKFWKPAHLSKVVARKWDGFSRRSVRAHLIYTAETASAKGGIKRLFFGMFSKGRVAYPQIYPQITQLDSGSHDRF